jgi:hypothetical protein
MLRWRFTGFRSQLIRRILATMKLTIRLYKRACYSVPKIRWAESYPFRGHGIEELMPVPIVVAKPDPIADQLLGSDTFRPRLSRLTSHANGVTILHRTSLKAIRGHSNHETRCCL